jgi:hypothetical protein
MVMPATGHPPLAAVRSETVAKHFLSFFVTQLNYQRALVQKFFLLLPAMVIV